MVALNVHSILLRIRMRSGVQRFTPTSEYVRKKESLEIEAASSK